MALTSTFSTISASQTDANSPLDEVLMDAIRQDIDVLYEWMGGPTYTPSTSHDHNGVNSKNISGASLAFLETQTITTASSAASVSVTSKITTVYDDYIWIGENILFRDDNDILVFQVSTDNNATNSASDYWIGNPNTALSGPNANISKVSLNNSTTIPMTFTMRFYNPNTNSVSKCFEWKGSTPITVTGVLNSFDHHCMWNVTGAGNSVNAFKLSVASAISGTFKFYGIKKT